MLGGLPKFTRYLSANVDIEDILRYQPTLAEIVTKEHVNELRTSAGDFCEITPDEGKVIVLLVISCTSQVLDDAFTVKTLQSTVMTNLIGPFRVQANGHFMWAFPCWKPDQDTGDGETVTFKITCGGSGNFNGFVLYYQEDA
ncbi:MAG: hypothetical protein KAT00_14850 [Planctomycetes bacterium]|nr:hypothetical protein [Planctomycetota bacterium]